jgi:hypothetical protein
VKLGIPKWGRNVNVSRLSASTGDEHRANKSSKRYTGDP